MTIDVPDLGIVRGRFQILKELDEPSPKGATHFLDVKDQSGKERHIGYDAEGAKAIVDASNGRISIDTPEVRVRRGFGDLGINIVHVGGKVILVGNTFNYKDAIKDAAGPGASFDRVENGWVVPGGRLPYILRKLKTERGK
jgi:hypothetical protein